MTLQPFTRGPVIVTVNTDDHREMTITVEIDLQKPLDFATLDIAGIRTAILDAAGKLAGDIYPCVTLRSELANKTENVL